MANFGKRSLEQLKTCHPDLQKILIEAIKDFDFTILEGHRGEERQDELYKEGYSQVIWPASKHNSTPSMAADIAPYPIEWDNIDRFKELARHIKKCALKYNLAVRWGGDWLKFKDYPHFELA